ncbi:nuclear RNA export factor 2 [Drosophila innubila]|uniref:nuclear RNA export factor 2 n=1 Tax=Drosophila innubila TaxID=198719 RepID=UPI00148B79DD|nr:nuclear RNA export factor 2 [Drosophila innubila]
MHANRHRSQARIIDFGDRSQPIVVDYRDSKKYYKCKQYDGNPGLNWIEFCVHHEGALNFSANPQQLIVDALFRAVEGEELFPVNYQSGHHVDTFLARTCKAALDKLFQRRLSIKVSSGSELNLSVSLNAAAYNRSQISPPMIISQVIDRLMDSLETFEGVRGVLNLSNFTANPYFKNVIVRLSNLATLQLVCTTIYNNDDRRRALNGFNLAQNQISDLGPLKLFGDVDYGMLDLSGNRLSSAVRLCTDLQRVRAKQLKLADNPITKKSQYPDCLEPLKKNFQIVDGIPFDKLYKTYTPLNYEVDVECDGTRIDWTNKSTLAQFRNSLDWHAFLIPDTQREFTKDLIFDYFSISLDPGQSEFYPCYYKFDGGEHRFLVRSCFDQIEHLVQMQNLQLKIPQLVTSGDVQEINYDRTIPYYLRMNVSTFKQGHIDPKQCIEQAVQKRFNAINRVLNLEQFQQTDGLENVTVLLSSPKVLSSILRMSSRKFVGNCIDLRLGNNKIVSANNLRSLSLLSSLQALDLGQNWINDLSEISSLGDVPLKSLRLHGNPVCRKYSLPSEYIKAVKAIFPTLLKLDDVDLNSKPGLAPQKDFLCDTAAYELTGELFLKPFLREFEQLDQRVNMMKYYTDKSLFTLTSSYDINRCNRPSNELFKRINKYNYHSRNLLKNSLDTCRVNVGANDIIAVLMQLPVVTHDYVSLQTDVMHYNAKLAIINVTGLMRDEPDLLMAFSRQFVLKVEAEGLGVGKRVRRMKIINERFNIMNPTKKQERDAFKFSELPNEATVKDENEEDSVDVKEHKLLLFQEITGLRPRWCTRIVQEEANWNFELALEQFLRMESDKELPNDAFA